ncbi:hypothetical protein ACFJIW_15960 [Tahibacter sp. UC22_41]|uniref:hypothetical protein n=1 Tax=Tahibacter sp. UC22_41 TaxID=3350178 RepID=UPI0036DDE56D
MNFYLQEIFGVSTDLRPDELFSLVPRELESDEINQVFHAFSIGKMFDVDALVSQPEVVQYLHESGAVRALPCIIEAVISRSDSAIPLLTNYLFRYGFSGSLISAENCPLFLRYSPADLQIRNQKRRQVLVNSIPVEARAEFCGWLIRLIVTLHTSDGGDSRAIKKFLRWLRSISSASADDVQSKV